MHTESAGAGWGCEAQVRGASDSCPDTVSLQIRETRIIDQTPGALPLLHSQPSFPGVGGKENMAVWSSHPKSRISPSGASLQKLLEIFKCHTVPLNNKGFSVSRNESFLSSQLPPPQPWSGFETHHSFLLPPSLPPSPALRPAPFHLLCGMRSAHERTCTPDGGQTKDRVPSDASQEERTGMKAG